jgi:hypothetical protein
MVAMTIATPGMSPQQHPREEVAQMFGGIGELIFLGWLALVGWLIYRAVEAFRKARDK